MSNTTGTVTLVSYANTDAHVASIHRSGCRDIVKDAIKHQSRRSDTHEFSTIEAALIDWIDEGLAVEVDDGFGPGCTFTRSDVRIFSCAKGGA